MVFSEQCGSGHEPSAAGAHAFVGPSLDELRPSAAQVEAAIKNGGAKNDARRVARYVARLAGR